MRRSSWFRLAVLLLPVSLLAAACGGSDDDGQAASSSTTGPPAEEGCDETVPGSQIDYGVFAPTASLDPPFVSGGLVGGTELASVYDVLMAFDPETNEYEPKLAESLEPNDDHTQWTLKLREGISYSDGTPLTAQMVSDSMDRLLQSGVRNTSGGFLGTISSKTVVDELTLDVTLSQPWVDFPFVFADEPGMVVNVNAIGDDPEAFGAQPPDAAGLGPYVVERNVPGEELVLKARSDYWDGPVCVETLRFVFVPGSQGTYDALRSGQLDVGFVRDSVVWAAARDNGEQELSDPQDGGALLLVNHDEGRPGSNPKVREAMALAVDENVINDRAYGGDLLTSKSLVQPGSRYESDDIDAFPTDVDRARAALDEAKADGFDGRIEVVCANVPPTTEVALTTEALLEAVGFDVTVSTKPTAEHIGQIIQGDYDVACWGINAGASTAPTAWRSNLHSGSPSNRAGYANPAMDAALDEFFAAPDEDARKAAVAEVNRIYLDDFVGVPFGAPEEGIVFTPEVKGIRPTVSTIFLFDKAYLEQ